MYPYSRKLSGVLPNNMKNHRITGINSSVNVNCLDIHIIRCAQIKYFKLEKHPSNKKSSVNLILAHNLYHCLKISTKS